MYLIKMKSNAQQILVDPVEAGSEANFRSLFSFHAAKYPQ